jgi:hypothetical protein
MAAIPPIALMPDEDFGPKIRDETGGTYPKAGQKIDPAQHDRLDQRFYLWRLSGAFAWTHNRNNNQDGFQCARH